MNDFLTSIGLDFIKKTPKEKWLQQNEAGHFVKKKPVCL